MLQRTRLLVFGFSFAGLFAVGAILLCWGRFNLPDYRMEGSLEVSTAPGAADQFVGSAVQTVDNPDEWKSVVGGSRCILFVGCSHKMM